LAEHEWSKWINLDFTINLLVRVHGMAQLYLINADGAARPPAGQLEADRPPAPSCCRRLGRPLRGGLGPYRTLGRRGDVAAQRTIDEKTFMDDLYRAFDDRAQVIPALDAK
jgi:hypothetical protein